MPPHFHPLPVSDAGIVTGPRSRPLRIRVWRSAEASLSPAHAEAFAQQWAQGAFVGALSDEHPERLTRLL